MIGQFSLFALANLFLGSTQNELKLILTHNPKCPYFGL